MLSDSHDEEKHISQLLYVLSLKYILDSVLSLYFRGREKVIDNVVLKFVLL